MVQPDNSQKYLSNSWLVLMSKEYKGDHIQDNRENKTERA